MSARCFIRLIVVLGCFGLMSCAEIIDHIGRKQCNPGKPPPGWQPERLATCPECRGTGAFTYDPRTMKNVPCGVCGGRGQVPDSRPQIPIPPR